MSPIPTLTTERLTLRGHEPGDLDAFFAMRSDPRVARHIGKNLLTRTQCWTRILAYRGMWEFLGYGFWAVTERATGAFVGDVGLADLRRDMEPSFEGQPEAGWIFAADASGKGYATEAMKSVFGWFDGAFAGRESVCMIDPGNAASLRVAEKCGFSRWTETTYEDDHVILFRRMTGGKE